MYCNWDYFCYTLFFTFRAIDRNCQRANTILNCPSLIIVTLCLTSASVDTARFDMANCRNLIFDTLMHLYTIK